MSNLLFHYCSTQAFQSIISSRSIWLSSLSSSNDSMEGQLATDQLLCLVKKRENNPAKAQKLQTSVAQLGAISDGLGFCLSKEKDRLSQWRGYADDGRGFSIGFSKSYLSEKICKSSNCEADITLAEVLYERTQQDELLRQDVEALADLVESKSRKFSDQQFKTYKQLITNRFRIKSSSFKEEAEWRLLSFFISNIHTDPDLRYRAVGSRLTPYKQIELKQYRGSIIEVVLGPKNTTPIEIVKNFLSSCGFHDVRVEKSEATYR